MINTQSNNYYIEKLLKEEQLYRGRRAISDFTYTLWRLGLDKMSSGIMLSRYWERKSDERDKESKRLLQKIIEFTPIGGRPS